MELKILMGVLALTKSQRVSIIDYSSGTRKAYDSRLQWDFDGICSEDELHRLMDMNVCRMFFTSDNWLCVYVGV